MNNISISRGREGAVHKREKRRAMEVYRRWGCNMVIAEYFNIDVIACKRIDGAFLKIGTEIENSPKHVLINIERDCRLGCDHVFVLCPDKNVLKQVHRKLDRYLPEELLQKVTVLFAEDFTTEALDEWFDQEELMYVPKK